MTSAGGRYVIAQEETLMTLRQGCQRECICGYHNDHNYCSATAKEKAEVTRLLAYNRINEMTDYDEGNAGEQIVNNVLVKKETEWTGFQEPPFGEYVRRFGTWPRRDYDRHYRKHVERRKRYQYYYPQNPYTGFMGR